jgi:DNA-binding Xre family transcriptional regulator
MNERLRLILLEQMDILGLNKTDISDIMEWSYPTTLNKIDNPGTLKISEADRLCKALNLNLSDFLTNNFYDE